jgi:hypothetical protein
LPLMGYGSTSAIRKQLSLSKIVPVMYVLFSCATITMGQNQVFFRG